MSAVVCDISRAETINDYLIVVACSLRESLLPTMADDSTTTQASRFTHNVLSGALCVRPSLRASVCPGPVVTYDSYPG